MNYLKTVLNNWIRRSYIFTVVSCITRKVGEDVSGGNVAFEVQFITNWVVRWKTWLPCKICCMGLNYGLWWSCRKVCISTYICVHTYIACGILVSLKIRTFHHTYCKDWKTNINCGKIIFVRNWTRIFLSYSISI